MVGAGGCKAVRPGGQNEEWRRWGSPSGGGRLDGDIQTGNVMERVSGSCRQLIGSMLRFVWSPWLLLLGGVLGGPSQCVVL